MQILQATLAIAVCACLAGCNARFDADFEADTPGAPPALNPPGAPNDEIVIHTSPANGGGIVIRVTDEPDLVPAGGPHRFMSLEHEPDPGSSSVASLVTAPMATGTRSIFLQWEQVLDAGGTGTIAIFGHPDDSPSDPEACRIFTGNDVITLECNSSTAQVTGFDTHAVHTVLVRIDRSPHRIVLQVSQGGSTTPLETITSADLPSPIEGQRFVIQIEHEGQSDSAYRFNRFDVQERDPN